MTDYSYACPHCCAGGVTEERAAQLESDARALWSYRVHHARAKSRGYFPSVIDDEVILFRIARDYWHSLPSDEQEKIGACP